ncbi:hypothetical protein RHDE110596_08255 [Prescottella defluvii]|uniref:hypothetical protein n=1 Tax=Prescottella defluvii TaxID=1323361 RepID=UPI0006913287|nr:hypothetical protein [Prescottella defluvii]
MRVHKKSRRPSFAPRSATVLLALLAGVLVVSVGLLVGGFGTDSGEGTPAVAAADEAGAPDDPLARTRTSLQQAGMPLSFLSGGVDQLADGGRQLDDGANQLSDGLGQARAGADQLADGLAQLNGGVAQLGDGAGQVSGGVDEVVDRLGSLGGVQQDVTNSLRQVADSLALSPDPVTRGAATRVADLVGQLDTQGLGPDTLAQLQALKSGARQLSFELGDPSAQFVSGMGQVRDGALQLSEGLGLLDDGGRQLVDGTGQLVDGTGPITNIVGSLSTSVGNASEALPTKGDVEARNAASEMEAPAESPISWSRYLLAAFAVLAAAGVAGMCFVLGRRSTGADAAGEEASSGGQMSPNGAA